MKNSKNQAKKTPFSNDSFLEAFRGLGSDMASSAKDNLKAGFSDIENALFPFSQPKDQKPPENSPSDWAKDQEFEKKFRSHLRQNEMVHREEKVLFTRRQKENQQQVKSLQEEIRKLAKSVSNLASEAKEAETATLQELPTVGAYHLTFFEKLRKVLAELRSKLQESSYWLAAWNKKSQKKNFYWKQFKKSGSKFMLSSDRYMSTQAG